MNARSDPKAARNAAHTAVAASPVPTHQRVSRRVVHRLCPGRRWTSSAATTQARTGAATKIVSGTRISSTTSSSVNPTAQPALRRRSVSPNTISVTGQATNRSAVS